MMIDYYEPLTVDSSVDIHIRHSSFSQNLYMLLLKAFKTYVRIQFWKGLNKTQQSIESNPVVLNKYGRT